MFRTTKAFSGFSVDDPATAKRFYGETLGIEVTELSAEHGLLQLELAGGERPTLIYGKDDHVPATFTILNFPVDDIEEAITELEGHGIDFERYEGTPMETDERGIFRGGPDPDPDLPESPLIAWFKDPAGNTLSVIEET